MESIKTIIEQRETKRRRGDGLFVALLFVVAIPAAALVFYLTDAFIGNTDDIRAFVPKNAVVYVHLNGQAATEKALTSSARMPADVHPHEMAIFAVPGDDGLQWSTVIEWARFRPPTASEKTSLDVRGAIALDDRHFLIGDASVATAAKLAAAVHSSLADDSEISGALDVAATRAPVQVFVDSPALVTQQHSSELESLLSVGDHLEPIIASVVIRGGSFQARMVAPESSAAVDATTQARSAALARELGRVDADVTVSEPQAGFDPALLFLNDPSATDGASQKPSLDRIAQLRSALNAPYALWLSRGQSGTGLTFLMHMPTVTPSVAGTAVAELIDSENPSLVNFTMPDGETAQEFRIDAPVLTARDRNDHVYGSGQNMVIVGFDGNAGALLTNSADLLQAYRTSATKPADRLCSPEALSEVHIKSLGNLLADQSAFGSLFGSINVQTVTFGVDVDKRFFLCGRNL